MLFPLLQVPPWVRDVLYLTAVLNSCINPIIYGVYYSTERKKRPNRINYCNRSNLLDLEPIELPWAGNIFIICDLSSMSKRSVRETRAGTVVTTTEASATTFLM